MEVLTYPMEERGNTPAYKFIYEAIRNDICNGVILPGERLPSKRTLSSHLGVAIITIENAYSLLELEGYIYTLEKKGYYVSEDISSITMFSTTPENAGKAEKAGKDGGKQSERLSGKSAEANIIADFTYNHAADSFSYDTWLKISRKIMLDREGSFLEAPPGQGTIELRNAISAFLYKEKGIAAPTENIIIGPGTEYLHHILIQLLGRSILAAVEDPGYKKVGRIYEANGVKVLHIPVDEKGLILKNLDGSNAKLVHTSPSHHFPTGCVMPASRRHGLLKWAYDQDAYIIEDDYDSEFRFSGRPITPLYSMGYERVVYMNTFTRSLAPSIRIAYMILPDKLMEKYRERLYFYSGTVSAFEQYTLAEFLNGGYYGRHIRRIRNRYKGYRENFFKAISDSGLAELVNVKEDMAGLHLIVETKKDYDSAKVVKLLRDRGVLINSLTDYCYSNLPFFRNKYLICYDDSDMNELMKAMQLFTEILKM